MDSLSASEARTRLPELLDRVTDGEEITITRHGQPVAVVVRPDTLRSRQAGSALREAEQVANLLRQAGAEPIPSEGLTPERAEELVRTIRIDRDGRSR